jgi:uncharacterized membrane protein YidH (DUF202 family)
MSPFTLGLALILTGIVFAAIGLVNAYYNKIVFRNYEEYDAVITKLKSVKGKNWSPYETVVPYAEYSVEGRLVTGAYYTMLASNIVRLNVGDDVTVQVNPKNPKVFRIQEIEDTEEMQKVLKRSPIITAIGAAILLAGIAVLLLM